MSKALVLVFVISLPDTCVENLPEVYVSSTQYLHAYTLKQSIV